jgi:hypothetical protein
MKELPIACELDPSDIAARGDELLPGLVRRAAAVEEASEGLRLRFPQSTEVLREITQVIDAERRCCRFLRFQITVESGGGPIWLEVNGPPGTREFLSQLIQSFP